MVKNPTLIGFMCLIMFLASCLGIVLLFMIINSKDISITYDWIITIVTVSSGIIAFIGLRDIFNRNFQTGGYFIIIGWTVALLCMLLTYFEGKENQEDYKLCPYCRNNIYLGATVCQYCHKDIPPEKGNTWQCPKCNENNPNNTYQCLKCGYQLL
jgi:ribosomal protein L40E